MKINLKKLSDQTIKSTTSVVKMRLSEHATSMVFQLFTKNVYSNPIGTVVREITSNCFDSHTEAKVNLPVVIRMSVDKETNTKYISFIDFGVGMSPDRVNNIYGVYFESTKRIDNEQIGGFGIGGKTPLAYKRTTGVGEGEYDNSFFVITNFNGRKYYYCIYEGSDSPIISLLHEEETNDCNGTEVRIPILEKDIDNFTKEMVKQLYYFENVVFEGFEDVWRYNTILSNTYQIIRAKDFLFRGKEYSEVMHICLGRVAYPIDYSVLGLNSSDYRLPVALRFEVGELNVTVSRESIDYSENTIKLLKKKLEEAKKEIIDMLIKQYDNIVNLDQYFKVKNDFGQLYFSNGTSMYVGNLIKQSDVSFVNFAYNVLKMPNDKQLYKLFFNTRTFGKKPSRSRYSNKYEFTGGYKELEENNNLYFIEGELIRKVIKQAYLKSEHEMYHIISKRDILDSFILSEIYELFSVNLRGLYDANGKLEPIVQTLLDMQEEYYNVVKANASDYDAIEIPESFIENRKNIRKQVTPEMLKISIPLRFTNAYGTNRVILNNLFKFKMPIFWGTKEDEILLNDAHTIYSILFDAKHIIKNYSYNEFTNSDSYNKDNKLKRIMFVQIAQNNVKYMKYCYNAHHISEFKNRMAYRKENIITEYFQSHDIIEDYHNIDRFYRSDSFSIISKTWGNKINKVNSFIERIPEHINNNIISNHKYLISRYYDISNIKLTKEQESIVKDIESIRKLKNINEPYMKHINLPYYISDIEKSKELLDIVLKVMKL